MSGEIQGDSSWKQLFIAQKLPSHCSFKSDVTFFIKNTTMWKPWDVRLWKLDSCTKKKAISAWNRSTRESLEISLDWRWGLKIKTNFILISGVDFGVLNQCCRIDFRIVARKSWKMGMKYGDERAQSQQLTPGQTDRHTHIPTLCCVVFKSSVGH